MGFRVTARPRVGPLVFNMGKRGLSSVSFAAGPVRYRLWSASGGKRGLSSVDLPGPLSYRGRR